MNNVSAPQNTLVRHPVKLGCGHYVFRYRKSLTPSGGRTGMYQVFDKFLASSTWQYHVAADTERFYEALDQVVRVDVFDPEAMGDYIGWKIGASRYDSDFVEAIRRCTADARAIRGFLKTTNRL